MSAPIENVQSCPPFFKFYGAKHRIAKHYPAPMKDIIIEPFAGAAGYSCRYPYKKVFLYDLDEKICGIWEYLIRASEKEIMALPSYPLHVNEIDGPQEAKWLVGWWLNPGSSSPKMSPSAWCRSVWESKPNLSFWCEGAKIRIAKNLSKIRHWKIFNKSFEFVPNAKATWFIDPPYQNMGKHYKHGSDQINFSTLAKYCIERRGQVIVCEGPNAKWLPFRHFLDAPNAHGKQKAEKVSKETIYYQLDGSEDTGDPLEELMLQMESDSYERGHRR